jgi:hypothetical protein
VSELKDLENRITLLESQMLNELRHIKTSMDNFSLKLEHVLALHLKIIYWLLVVITITLVGVKGVEQLIKLGGAS